MGESNRTVLTFFIIKGISDNPEMEAPVFLLVLLIYLIGLCGNLTIFILVCLDSQLKRPMYFFLCHLSIMDISASTNTLHKVFIIFISGDNKVSYIGCMIQMFLFLSLTGQVLFILTAMSYDRYVAVCNPLRYLLVMNHKMCTLLVTFCWLLGFCPPLPEILMILSFSCYRSNKINHFFCDIMAIMKITCSDTSALEFYIHTGGTISGLMAFFLTLISYIFIISTILSMRTNTGRQKAFHTCSSHLTVVVLLYVNLFCQYLTPTSTNNMNSTKLLSVFNTAVVPMLNPLIYSLNNKDVKAALGRKFRSCKNVAFSKSLRMI